MTINEIAYKFAIVSDEVRLADAIKQYVKDFGFWIYSNHNVINSEKSLELLIDEFDEYRKNLKGQYLP